VSRFWFQSHSIFKNPSLFHNSSLKTVMSSSATTRKGEGDKKQIKTVGSQTKNVGNGDESEGKKAKSKKAKSKKGKGDSDEEASTSDDNQFEWTPDTEMFAYTQVRDCLDNEQQRKELDRLSGIDMG
jgi:hypothetical protein